MHSDYSTKNYAPKWHKMLDGITIKQLYYALKRESWYSTTHEKTLVCPICRSQLSLEEPCEHVKAQIKNTGDEYDTRWLKEKQTRKEQKQDRAPMRTTKHRYGAPDGGRLHIRNKKAVLGPGKGERTRERMGREEHEEAGIQDREKEVGGEGEWPDIIADHYK